MARRLPPLNPLRAFEVAARHASFKSAGEELNLTQSAISRQVKTLEDYLRVSLFRRDNRTLELTEAGKQYLPALTQAFDTIDHATARLFNVGHKNRLFVKSSLRTFLMGWLVPRLPSFRDQRPDLEVNLSTSLSISSDDLFTEPVDIAISRDRPDVDGIRQETLLEEFLVPVCSPRLLESAGQVNSPGDLSRFTALHNSSRSDCWQVWLKGTGFSGVRLGSELHFDGFYMTIQAAIAGMGVAILPVPIAQEALRLGHLVQPLKRSVPSGDSYYLLYLSHRCDLPKIKDFRDWLFAEVAKDKLDPTREANNVAAQ